MTLLLAGYPGYCEQYLETYRNSWVQRSADISTEWAEYKSDKLRSTSSTHKHRWFLIMASRLFDALNVVQR